MIPALAFAAGCFLDTTPLVPSAPSASGPMLVDSGAEPKTPSMQMSPVAATMLDAGRDAGMPVVVADAGAVKTRDPSPPASTGMSPAGSLQPSATDAASNTPPVVQCDAPGSYALRAAIDVVWDATSWSDMGRGTVELLGLVQVEAIDAQTRKASASFRACGLSLPALNSSALCSSYQLQIPDAIWRDDRLPTQKLGGSYHCVGQTCELRLAPVSYSLGIRLADETGPWPELESTALSQFKDDDADGFAGVSVDVASLASLATGPNGCGPSNGNGNANGSSNGNGPMGRGNPMQPTVPGLPTMPPTAAPTQLGRLLLGLRTQLTAAMQLAPDCKLSQVSASDASVGLRSAGCFVTAGTDPASASASCTEQIRAEVDRSLPSYEVLEQGQIPRRTPIDNLEPSTGTILQVVRLSASPSCDSVRSAMF